MFVKVDPKPEVPWYESLIARHAPLWAAQRQYYRSIRTAQATVRGGISTRTSESYERLNGLKFDSSANRALGINARDRGRNVYENNPVAESLIDTETDNVVAEGFTLQAKTEREAFNARPRSASPNGSTSPTSAARTRPVRSSAWSGAAAGSTATAPSCWSTAASRAFNTSPAIGSRRRTRSWATRTSSTA
jgi:hypothetical protein